MLSDAKLPIMSFGLYLLAGSTGTGKTTQANKIMEAYND